jgi:hypothetical protein
LRLANRSKIGTTVRELSNNNFFNLIVKRPRLASMMRKAIVAMIITETIVWNPAVKGTTARYIWIESTGRARASKINVRELIHEPSPTAPRIVKKVVTRSLIWSFKPSFVEKKAAIKKTKAAVKIEPRGKLKIIETVP